MVAAPIYIAGIDTHKRTIAVAVVSPQRVVRVFQIRTEPLHTLYRRLVHLGTRIRYAGIEWPYLGKSPQSFAAVLETAATVRTILRLQGVPTIRVRGSEWMRILHPTRRTRPYLKTAARQLARRVTGRVLTSDASDAVCIGLWLLDRLVVQGRIDPPVPLLQRAGLRAD